MPAGGFRMALLNSQALGKERVDMTEQRIATEDIVEENALGQTVVVVPAGQPIPPGVEVPEAKKPKAKSKKTSASKGD
jgi:precorrin-6B methylase 1